MAKLITCLLFLTILFTFICLTMSKEAHHHHHPKRNGSGRLKPYQCGGKCSRRCSKTQHHKACMFFCQKCCAKCLCVPPGTYGHKEVCPCYNNWKTQQGGPKCP